MNLPFKIALTLASIVPIALLSHDLPGPGAGFSGAPGDSNCAECHGTGVLPNTSTANVTINFPSGLTYSPGVKQHLQVVVTDAAAKRWGFEASPRAASKPQSTGAGTLATSDKNTQLYSSGGLRWIAHTFAGAGHGNTFEFDWTPPATDIGPVIIYVSSNAGNGNGQADRGDHVYMANYTLTPATSGGSKPIISAVVNGASFQPGIEEGSWVAITGQNLSVTTRIWNPQTEIVNGTLPVSLDGVSVNINGKAAAVYFISPNQINVQAPSDSAEGPVDVVVETGAGASDPAVAQLQKESPAFFLFDPQGRKYIAALIARSDGGVDFLGPNGLFGSALATRPAKPGEIIELYGTGFGPTNPVVPAGQVFSGAAPTTEKVTVTIGGVTANVLFAGITSSGLYQINVVVPNLPPGDQKVTAMVGSAQSPDGTFVTVGN
jgi:uncharacterized protein (TIGR03437 family)